MEEEEEEEEKEEEEEGKIWKNANKGGARERDMAFYLTLLT